MAPAGLCVCSAQTGIIPLKPLENRTKPPVLHHPVTNWDQSELPFLLLDGDFFWPYRDLPQECVPADLTEDPETLMDVLKPVLFPAEGNFTCSLWDTPGLI